MPPLLNGRIPLTLLTRLPWAAADHLYLRPGAAYWAGLLAAAFARHFGKPLYLSDAYRTLDQQKVLKKTKGRFAATPGTSNHGWGLAIDAASRVNVDTSAEHRWFELNAPAYGWVNPWWATNRIPGDGEYEPWHWEFTGSPDVVPAPRPPAAVKPTPAPLPTLNDDLTEDDMRDILIALYLKNVGRRPDPIGAQAYIAAVATGALTWAQVDERLGDSDESRAFAALGSEEARNARRATGAGQWPND